MLETKKTCFDIVLRICMRVVACAFSLHSPVKEKKKEKEENNKRQIKVRVCERFDDQQIRTVMNGATFRSNLGDLWLQLTNNCNCLKKTNKNCLCHTLRFALVGPTVGSAVVRTLCQIAQCLKWISIIQTMT